MPTVLHSHLTNLFWTLSTASILVCWQGFQMTDAYSKMGRTSVMYERIVVLVENFRKELRLIKPRTWKARENRLLRWRLKFNLESTITPRSFIEFTLWSWMPFILYGCKNMDFRRVKEITLYLGILGYKCHLWHHWEKLSMSFWSWRASWRLSTLLTILQSSAYKNIEEEMTFGRSFMYELKSRGPKMLHMLLTIGHRQLILFGNGREDRIG